MSQKSHPNVKTARDLARQYEWEEVGFDNNIAVVRFQTKSENPRGLIEVNYYYNTGITGTTLPHPRSHSTQVFAQVHSAPQLKAIFREPRRHPNAGYRFKESKLKTKGSPLTSERAAIQSQLTKIDHEAKDLARDRKHLQELLRKLPSQYTRGERKKTTFPTRKAENIYFSIHPRTAKAFTKTWRGDATSVSLARGYCTVHKNGTVSSVQIPRYLASKIQSRSQPVAYVSLGSQDRYYVRFADGEWQCVASDSCIEEIEAAACGVHKLAFGPEWDSFFILFQDGSTVWNDLPIGLHNKLNGRQASLPVVEDLCISAVPCTSSERKSSQTALEEYPWFVRFTDGSWEARNLPDHLDSTLKVISQDKGDVTCINFGAYNSWLVRHTPGVKSAETVTETSTILPPAPAHEKEQPSGSEC